MVVGSKVRVRAKTGVIIKVWTTYVGRSRATAEPVFNFLVRFDDGTTMGFADRFLAEIAIDGDGDDDDEKNNTETKEDTL